MAPVETFIAKLDPVVDVPTSNITLRDTTGSGCRSSGLHLPSLDPRYVLSWDVFHVLRLYYPGLKEYIHLPFITIPVQCINTVGRNRVSCALMPVVLVWYGPASGALLPAPR